VGIADLTEVVRVKPGDVGRPVLDGLRGSLHRWSAHRGILVTTGSFTRDAREAASEMGVAPIQLIDGDRLVDLLVEHGIGVKQQAVKLWRFDPEPFTAGRPSADAAEDEPGVADPEGR
jgi:restriction system protein